MKVSYQWLSEFVDLSGYTPDSLAELLTGAGLAVDAVESRNLGVEGVVVGVVRDMEHHPDADRLNVCQVDVGQAELLQIVCGAPNVRPGMIVPVALPGAKLPGGKEIKRAKLRGVTSNGMLCSASEIGLDTRLLPASQTTGLYALPEDTEIGKDITQVLHLDDWVLDIDLTPNRSDCLSIRGLAYEIAALTKKPTSFPTQIEIPLPDVPSPIRVRIDSERCGRYDAQVLEGLETGASPLWMQARLMTMGVRPIDVIVDVTNYVMLEWGQPLHAFDEASIADQTIVVRQATDGETLQTLDGQTRTLDSDMLVIADPQKAIGLAGVMGGENSEIRTGTSRVVIESARFDAPSTRRTGQKLGLRSEAQQRFEKGIDPATVRNALLRATQLLIQLAGAQLVGGISTARRDQDETTLHRTVRFSPDRCRALLGCSIEDKTIQAIFSQLGFSVKQRDTEWDVSVPTRRPDIELQADLVEEVARIYGYDNIPSTELTGPITAGGRDARQQLLGRIREGLIASGLFEVRTYAFTSPEALAALQLPAGARETHMIPLMHPMSDERRVLRTHMLPSLAEVAKYNLAHRVDGGAIFELGRVYEPKESPVQSQPDEHTVVGLLWFGETSENIYGRSRPVDFFDAKGALDHLFHRLGIAVRYERANESWLHPGRSARMIVKDTVIGLVGEVHPATAEALDVSHSIYAQLSVESIIERLPISTTVHALPRFPGSRRDVALIVSTQVLVGDMLNVIKDVGHDYSILQNATVFDVYSGQGVPENHKSVAIAIHFQAEERTLTDSEIEDVVKVVLERLQNVFGAQLRG
ncbi:phenylalanine--tRNA ligase subunit beta [Alicyclobacillus dauci]|uniref:Phenylalanine--tRNA ligase beta subunit n=1 Tax=Alicyclobacillus dauci TaxID=1475485 RepID=A0ABY6Z8M5_9BACL|nr:phenylalanine--tRNA ligase subunit beta [Alicyclobacillus dauci]WAH38405.1 phenylalanine--tRNA ligase subunit beta [Alicyclobacillus dauci]